MLAPQVLPTGLRILVVDDDPKFRAFVGAGLTEHGVACATAANATEAMAVIHDEATPLDAALLDIMMPDTSGWNLLEQILATRPDVPVIFVTAREAVEERVRGLQMGADDYVIKPFAFAELLARIGVVVRRRRVGAVARGNLQLDAVQRTVQVSGKPVDLSPKEFDLLRALLLQEHDAPRSRKQLLRDVWHTDLDPETNIVEVHVARLRRKLAAAHGPSIVNRRGEGYTVEAAT